MSKEKHMYVICMGGIWKLTRSKWVQFLKDDLNSKEPGLDDYGPMIAKPGNVVDITDATKDQFEDWLEEEGK